MYNGALKNKYFIKLRNEKNNNKIKIDYIYPYKVYTTCNDVNEKQKGHNRNYSAAIYLDHFFNEIKEEKYIRFQNKSDKFILYSPIEVINSNEINPQVLYNNGKNIFENTIKISITGNDIVDSSFFIKHVSTLNSITKYLTP